MKAMIMSPTTVRFLHAMGLVSLAFVGTISTAAGPQHAGGTLPEGAGAGDVRRETTQPAHVEPFERTNILAKASGFASDVRVDIGDRVAKGDVLATLWIPEMEQERQHKLAIIADAEAAIEQALARVAATAASIAAAKAAQAEAQAGLAMHEATLALATSEHDRIRSLVSQRAVTETLLDEKRHKMQSAAAALSAAKAKVQKAAAAVEVAIAVKGRDEADANRARAQRDVAREDLQHTETVMEYARITAPYDGLITHRHVDTGDFVRSAGTSETAPLYTIVRDDRLRVVFDIPESQATLVAVGQGVVLVIDGLKGQQFEGTVSRTSGVLDPKTRTLRAEMDLVGTGSPLRPGMYGMATITLTGP